MQQHLEISAVTSSSGSEGTPKTSGDGLTMPELAGRKKLMTIIYYYY